MKKKYLSLFLALIMILGVIPTSIFAETGTQKYKITFIASKDVGNRDYGIEGIDGKESVSVDGGKYYRFKNEGHELNYYIDGKEVNGINPTNNTKVYVGVSGWGKNYYPVEEIEKNLMAMSLSHLIQVNMESLISTRTQALKQKESSMFQHLKKWI